MIKLGDLLGKISDNNVQLRTPENDEICFISAQCESVSLLSDDFLNAEVRNIEVDEDIPDTIIINIEFI